MAGLTQPKSTKEQLIFLLSQKWPQTAKQVHQSLKRETTKGITYQAIHKLLVNLENDGIAQKTEKGWQLNPTWLQSQEHFFQQTIHRYGEKKNRYDFDATFEGTQTFEFDNITDLNVETAKLLASRKLNPKIEPFYCVLEYGWWPFKFTFDQFELLYNMVKACPKTKFIIRKKTLFGDWISKQYQRIGGIGAPLGTPVDVNEDIFIQGDYIIQVKISDAGKKIIKHHWKKLKNLNYLFKEFGLKPEPKIHSTTTITKNPQLAQFMKIELDKYFK